MGAALGMSLPQETLIEVNKTIIYTLAWIGLVSTVVSTGVLGYRWKLIHRYLLYGWNLISGFAGILLIAKSTHGFLTMAGRMFPLEGKEAVEVVHRLFRSWPDFLDNRIPTILLATIVPPLLKMLGGFALKVFGKLRWQILNLLGAREDSPLRQTQPGTPTPLIVAPSVHFAEHSRQVDGGSASAIGAVQWTSLEEKFQRLEDLVRANRYFTEEPLQVGQVWDESDEAMVQVVLPEGAPPPTPSTPSTVPSRLPSSPGTPRRVGPQAPKPRGRLDVPRGSAESRSSAPTGWTTTNPRWFNVNGGSQETTPQRFQAPTTPYSTSDRSTPSAPHNAVPGSRPQRQTQSLPPAERPPLEAVSPPGPSTRRARPPTMHCNQCHRWVYPEGHKCWTEERKTKCFVCKAPNVAKTIGVAGRKAGSWALFTNDEPDLRSLVRFVAQVKRRIEHGDRNALAQEELLRPLLDVWPAISPQRRGPPPTPIPIPDSATEDGSRSSPILDTPSPHEEETPFEVPQSMDIQQVFTDENASDEARMVDGIVRRLRNTKKPGLPVDLEQLVDEWLGSTPDIADWLSERERWKHCRIEDLLIPFGNWFSNYCFQQ